MEAAKPTKAEQIEDLESQIESLEKSARSFSIDTEILEQEEREYKVERDNEGNSLTIRLMAARAIRHVYPELWAAHKMTKECTEGAQGLRRRLERMKEEGK